MFSQYIIATSCAFLIATCHAGLLPHGTEILTTGGAVHSAPSAVSHQSFTRVHNAAPHPSLQQPSILAPAYVSAPALKTFESHLPATEINAYAAAPYASQHSPPVVQPLVHTPAHLTYAAAPIVYKMLPMIKPVRAISYDSLKPSPRSNGYNH